MPAKDHADEALRVYRSRTPNGGFWHPEHGDLPGPLGWEFLPSGDAYVTRTVKKLGPHWVVVKKGKGYAATLGVLAPSANIETATGLAQETKASREKKRASSQKQRERQEDRYRRQFADAVLRYLDFAPEHSKLAQEIADSSAERATAVGSGRVGRTGKLTLVEKAALAARAHIRHQHTSFDDRLFERQVELTERELPIGADDPFYSDAKADAHREVDEFLWRHRRV